MNNKQIDDLVNLIFDTDMEEVMKEKSTLEYIHKLQKENKQLKSIITELEEWLNECLEKGDKHKFIIIQVKDVLDKIQKLKEKYK